MLLGYGSSTLRCDGRVRDVLGAGGRDHGWVVGGMEGGWVFSLLRKHESLEIKYLIR